MCSRWCSLRACVTTVGVVVKCELQVALEMRLLTVWRLEADMRQEAASLALLV